MSTAAKKNADGDLRFMLRILMEMKGEAFPTSTATWVVCMKQLQDEAADTQPLPFTADDIIKLSRKRHCRKNKNE